jgi:hypothetical protein
MTIVKGVTVPTEAVGNMSCQTGHGYVTLTGVSHMLGLNRTLMSVPELTSNGFTITMVIDKCMISGKQWNVMSTKKSGSIYPISCYTGLSWCNRELRVQNSEISWRCNVESLFHVNCLDMYKMNRPTTTITRSLFCFLPYRKRSEAVLSFIALLHRSRVLKLASESPFSRRRTGAPLLSLFCNGRPCGIWMWISSSCSFHVVLDRSRQQSQLVMWLI